MARFQDLIARGVRADQPLPADVSIGALYCITDEDDIIERNNGSAWESYSPAGGGGSGDVSGPGASADNAIARWSGTGGDTLLNSTPTVEDAGTLSNLTDPTALQDAATKNYVDTQIAAVNVPGASQTSFLVSGGQVVWIENYEFLVSAARYYITGVAYTSAETTITLDAADPTDDRIDTIAVNSSSAVVKVTGTAAAQPSGTDINPGTQLKLGLVLVRAATTEPEDVSDTLLYADNAGSPTEWDWTTSGSGWDVNSTVDPLPPSTKCIDGTAVANGAYAQGQIGTGTFDPSEASQLVLYLKSKATWSNNRGLSITLRLAGVIVGQAVVINRTGSFGFVSSQIATYQLVAIPINQFAVPFGTAIDQIRITDFGGAIGCVLDNVYFQVGAASQAATGITQDQADARYRQLAVPLVLSAAADVSGTLPLASLVPAVANEKVLGSGASGMGNAYTEITLGTNLSMSGTTLNATGGGSGGGIVLLEQHTASASASLDFTAWYSSTYDEYLIEILNVIPTTTSRLLYLRMSTDGGSTYDSTAKYADTVFASKTNTYAPSGATMASPAAQFNVIAGTGDGISNAATGGAVASLRLFNPGSTTLYKQLLGTTSTITAANLLVIAMKAYVYQNTSAVNALQFLMSGGTMASGTIRVYGVVKV